MKILYVTQANPDPHGAGWQRRAAQQLRALQQCGDVTVLLPRPLAERPDPGAVDRVRAMGAAQVIVRAEESMTERAAARQRQARGSIGRALASIGKLPWCDARAQPGDRAKYRPIVRDGFDLVFAFRIDSAIWVDSVLDPAERAPVSIVDFDDFESHNFAAMIAAHQHTMFWRRKLAHQLDWLQRTERRLLTGWTAACLCSELDTRRMAATYGTTPWVVPNGFSFDAPLPEIDTPMTELLFVGSFAHAPNVAGVLWFVEKIWPLVQAKLGQRARVTLAGFYPTPAVEALGEVRGVHVVANAPELESLYARATMVIAPILSGSGTRTKLIEAAAYGRAIVTTDVGCEGLDFADGVHAEIADTPEDFAARIAKLAGDRALRSTLGAAARSHALERFDAKRIESELAQRIDACIQAINRRAVA